MAWAARMVWLAMASLVGAPRPAMAAADDEHPPTPVEWPESTPCGMVINRSLDSIVHFEYGVPFEDLGLDPPLPDSRTHQFLAFCRDRRPFGALPNWISDDDVRRSEASGLLETGSPMLFDVLETSATWADCFVRLTADDDRRPISYAAAAAGFDWELSDVPIGVWQVVGYTFEPATNLWSPRSGFVKVIDDSGDPAQDVPAIQIVRIHSGWWVGGGNRIELCVDALGPATAIFEWRPVVGDAPWEQFDSIAIDRDWKRSSESAGTRSSKARPIAGDAGRPVPQCEPISWLS